MKALHFIVSILACTIAPGIQAGEREFPQRPVRIVVPAAPGGTADIIARILGPGLNAALGQPVVIDNRPGAGTVIGTELVAKAAPDGHTLLLPAAAHSINPVLMRKLPYDTLKDFAPVTLIAEVPNVLVVHPSIPGQTLKEFIAHVRSSGGKVTYASSGVGNATHLAGELFKSLLRVDMTHVPYKSGGPALTDLIGGQVDCYFSVLPSAMPHIRSGKLRALGVTGMTRSSVLPQSPTLNEAGVPGYEVTSWYGFLAPGGTPAPVVQRLQDELAKLAKSPDVQSRLGAQGAEAVASRPAEFDAFIRREITKWGKLVKEANIPSE